MPGPTGSGLMRDWYVPVYKLVEVLSGRCLCLKRGERIMGARETEKAPAEFDGRGQSCVF